MPDPDVSRVLASAGMPDAAWFQHEIRTLVQAIPPDYFRTKRWFGSKTRQITGYEVRDYSLLQATPPLSALLLLEIRYAAGEPEYYHLPLVVQEAAQAPATVTGGPAGIIATLRTPQGDLLVYDAFADDTFCAALYRQIAEGADLPAHHGTFRFAHVPNQPMESTLTAIRRVTSEQSNSSVIYNQAHILKGFRKVAPGQNPDFEVPYFLTTRTDFRYIPSVAGYFEYQPPGATAFSLGVLQAFVPNSGDGYTTTLDQVRAYFQEVEAYLDSAPAAPDAPDLEGRAAQFAAPYRPVAQRLGAITGLLHNALAADPTAPDFAPEPITPADVAHWEASIADLTRQIIKNIPSQLDAYPAPVRAQLETVAGHEQAYLALIGGLGQLAHEGVHKIRFHGDYHLGQVLKTGDDFVILDFEGEPLRPLAERRVKHCPLKDVAGMLRSFNYAAFAILFEAQARTPDAARAATLPGWALAWEALARQDFLAGYQAATAQNTGARYLPADPAAVQAALNVFELEKAFYELNYEFNNRPTWVPIPLKGLLRVLGE